MKKFLKQIALGLVVFIAINSAIEIFYQNKINKAVQNKTHRKHLRWNDIHENKDLYDLIVIGTSRAYDSYNPIIVDSALNIQSYNMSTAAQDIAESYYVLKEVFDYQNPKYIIFDLFYEASDDNYEYYQTLSNASFFSSTERKLKLIAEGYGVSGIVNYSIPLFKYKHYFKQDIGGLFKDTQIHKKEDQLIKGYLHNTVTATCEEISSFESLPKLQMTSFDKLRFTKYFNKIKNLVDKNNAQLICVRAPYPPTRLKLTDIDDEGSYFKAFTAKANIPFYDLNSFKKHSYIYLDQDFADYHHPNYKGAQKASKQLIEAIKDNKL